MLVVTDFQAIALSNYREFTIFSFYHKLNILSNFFHFHFHYRPLIYVIWYVPSPVLGRFCFAASYSSYDFSNCLFIQEMQWRTTPEIVVDCLAQAFLKRI